MNHKIETARHAAVARNLDALLATHAHGRIELAERLDIPVKWVRTVVSTGVARTERRNAGSVVPSPRAST